MALLEDIGIDALQSDKGVHPQITILPVAVGATDALGYYWVIVVERFGKRRRDKDDMVGIGNIAAEEDGLVTTRALC